MTAAQLIGIAAQLSLGGILLSAALGTDLRELGSLFRRPGLLVRTVLAMNIVMPAIAIAMARAFNLYPAIEAALVALALGPVPPIIAGKLLKAGGAHAYAMGLMTATSLVSIVFVPLALALLGDALGRPLHVPFATVALLVFKSLLLPLLLGAVIRAAAPALAMKIVRPVTLVSNVLLVLVLVPLVVVAWPQMVALTGRFALVAIVAFVLAGLLVGHVLGGPDPDERTVLALCTATRHPGMAVLILRAGQEDPRTAFGAVLLVLLVGAIASAPYARWRGRVHATAHPA